MSTNAGKIPGAGDIIGLIEALAPPVLAEKWDNCGLQVGSRSRPVNRVWVALDPLPEVVHAAAQMKVDLLVTHHPLLFQPLRSIDVENGVGKIIEIALKAGITIYSAHTNLDSAAEGLNHILARMIGLETPLPLAPFEAHDDHLDIGKSAGMGRIGGLNPSMSLGDLARQVKTLFNLPVVKVVGESRSIIRRAAVCSGAGSSLLDAFLASDADVFVTGDVRYHDARKVEEHKRSMIDVGHFASEHIFIDWLAHRLMEGAHRSGWSVDIAGCPVEIDPFNWMQ